MDENGNGDYEIAITDDYGSAGGPDFVPNTPWTNDAGPDGLWPSSPPLAGQEDEPPPVFTPPVLDLQPVPVSPPNVGTVLNGLGTGALLLGAVALFFLFRGRRR